MSEGNGVPVLKIGRKGKVVFQIGDRPSFTVDAIAVQEQLAVQEAALLGEDRKSVPTDKVQDWHRLVWSFFYALITNAPAPEGGPPCYPEGDHLTLSEALELYHLLNAECKRLSDFFAPRSKDEPPSAESTVLTFSA